MAKQSNAKIGFENELWAAADAMRGNVSASDYRKIVVGLIFLKYVSDAFDFRYQELLNAEDYYEGDEEDRDAYIEKNVFFVPETARWSAPSRTGRNTGYSPWPPPPPRLWPAPSGQIHRARESTIS